ncbi:DUF7716 domain-containing protein [Methylomonas sp. YC3]
MKVETVSLEEVLTDPGRFKGWLFLEPVPWTAKSRGVLIVFDKDAEPSDELIHAWIEDKEWCETLDIATIEDIVFNAAQQIEKPRIDELVEAFTFYFTMMLSKIFECI